MRLTECDLLWNATDVNLEGLWNNMVAEVEPGNSDFSFWEQVHSTIETILKHKHIMCNRRITFVA